MTEIRMLRIETVLERRGVSRSQHYRDMERGLCTSPIRITQRSAAWPAHEIEALLRARIAGKTDAEIRALVAQLEAARAEADRVAG